MQTEITNTIIQKVPMLSDEQQQKILEFVDKLLDEQKSPSIWQRLDENLKQVPAEEIAELPADASENLNHYLYGSPKKTK